jgi:hypothetical protein
LSRLVDLVEVAVVGAVIEKTAILVIRHSCSSWGKRMKY